MGVPKSEFPGVKKGDEGGGEEGKRGKGVGEEKEERGPRAHSKNSDFGTPMIWVGPDTEIQY